MQHSIMSSAFHYMNYTNTTIRPKAIFFTNNQELYSIRTKQSPGLRLRGVVLLTQLTNITMCKEEANVALLQTFFKPKFIVLFGFVSFSTYIGFNKNLKIINIINNVHIEQKILPEFCDKENSF